MADKKPNTFGRMLKSYREGSNLTQEQLADELGTSVSNVRGWESDRWHPQVQTIMRIAYFFGSDLNEMMCWDEYVAAKER